MFNAATHIILYIGVLNNNYYRYCCIRIKYTHDIIRCTLCTNNTGARENHHTARNGGGDGPRVRSEEETKRTDGGERTCAGDEKRKKKNVTKISTLAPWHAYIRRRLSASLSSMYNIPTYITPPHRRRAVTDMCARPAVSVDRLTTVQSPIYARARAYNNTSTATLYRSALC